MTTARTFDREGHLTVRVPVYSIEQVGARLLNDRGERVTDLAVHMSGERGDVELPIASLPTATCILEISGPGDSDLARVLLPFRVQS